MTKVENLKKIALACQAGATRESLDLTPEHREFSFIFGLAPEGMTPFEYELVEKVEGNNVLLHLHKDRLSRFFEHLNPPIWDLFDSRDEIYLRLTILKVSTAENQEIVKAMADMIAHGGAGCDCGCG